MKETHSVNEHIKLLDVVALTEPIREHRLSRGQIGTVVEQLGPEVFEVEFSDKKGRTYAMVALQAAQLMVLHREPV
jgi:hypothetical protein